MIHNLKLEKYLYISDEIVVQNSYLYVNIKI